MYGALACPTAMSPSLHKNVLTYWLQHQDSEGKEAKGAAVGAPQSGAGHDILNSEIANLQFSRLQQHRMQMACSFGLSV